MEYKELRDLKKWIAIGLRPHPATEIPFSGKILKKKKSL